jgi:hypothetical protein
MAKIRPIWSPCHATDACVECVAYSKNVQNQLKREMRGGGSHTLHTQLVDIRN